MTARTFHPRAGNAETPFAAAAAHLGERDQINLPGRHTKLVRLSSTEIGILFHKSHIVTYGADGSVRVTTGGHHGHDDGQGSVTTKARIQEYAPGFRNLWQSKKKWYVRLAGYERALPFVDGMTLYPDGVLHYPGETHLEAVARLVAPPPPPPRLRRRKPNSSVATLPLAFRGPYLSRPTYAVHP